MVSQRYENNFRKPDCLIGKQCCTSIFEIFESQFSVRWVGESLQPWAIFQLPFFFLASRQ